LQSSHTVPKSDFWEDWRSQKCKKCLILLVPGERIELPTNGLQNRCSTAELTRRRACRVDNVIGTFTQRIPDHTKGPK
jgi:hypothetical protein